MNEITSQRRKTEAVLSSMRNGNRAGRFLFDRATRG